MSFQPACGDAPPDLEQKVVYRKPLPQYGYVFEGWAASIQLSSANPLTASPAICVT